MKPGFFQFENFSFDPDRLELWKDAQLIPLKVQPARLLLLLLENAPQTVSRTELQEKIWNNGTTVEFDHGLNACVNQLRKALGDPASQSKFITTLPKRGYKFLPKVTVFKPNILVPSMMKAVFALLIFAGVGLGIWTTFEGKNIGDMKRVYVAPIQLEGASLLEFDGIAQYALRLGTIKHIGNNKLQALQVINGDSLWREFDTHRSDYGVDYGLFITLLENQQGKYLVSAKMVDVSAERVLASMEFPSEVIDAKNMRLAAKKISHWSRDLLGAPKQKLDMRLVDAGMGYYDAMLRARRAFQTSNFKSLQSSYEAFDRALLLRPESIEARGGKAVTLAILAGSNGFPTNETYDKALSLAQDIRRTSGASAQSEVTRGFIFLYRDWDIPASRQAFDLAADLAPGDAIVHAWRASVLAASGDINGAAAAAELAVNIDPLSMAIAADKCWYLSAARRLDDAILACNWALEIEPNNFSATMMFVQILAKNEDFAAANKVLMAFIDSGKESKSTMQKNTGKSLSDKSALQATYCKIADNILPRVQQGKFPLVHAAAFEAGCGRYEKVAELLSAAKNGGESGMLFYHVDPRFDGFKSSKYSDGLDLKISKRNPVN